jgi:hypothetical protein
MSRKSILFAALLGVALLTGFMSFRLSRAGARQTPADAQTPARHTAWVEQSLRRMRSVKAGQTRADLVKVFTTEGGLSTGLRRTYVYRECPYFKVDVEFEPVGRPARDAEGRVTLEESDADVIKSISRPYLDWSITD